MGRKGKVNGWMDGCGGCIKAEGEVGRKKSLLGLQGKVRKEAVGSEVWAMGERKEKWNG